MNKAQWIAIVASVLLVIVLFTATQSNFFGERNVKTSVVEDAHDHGGGGELTADSIIYYAKQNLSAEQSQRLNELENTVSRGNVEDQKLHVYHQLASFWRDSARIFAPYAYYTAEAARLENSENSLTFAARLLLENLSYEENQRLKHWEADQAKDLFERSLKINPDNDSAKVGLGATILFGGSEAPMEGIQLIRSVVDKDSTNTYAQMTLAKASLMSGQLDKALDRLKKVTSLRPNDLEAVLLMAEVNERMDKKAEAVKWYQKSLALVPAGTFKQEIENRITELKNKN